MFDAARLSTATRRSQIETITRRHHCHRSSLALDRCNSRRGLSIRSPAGTRFNKEGWISIVAGLVVRKIRFNARNDGPLLILAGLDPDRSNGDIESLARLLAAGVPKWRYPVNIYEQSCP